MWSTFEIYMKYDKLDKKWHRISFGLFGVLKSINSKTKKKNLRHDRKITLVALLYFDEMQNVKCKFANKRASLTHTTQND